MTFSTVKILASQPQAMAPKPQTGTHIRVGARLIVFLTQRAYITPQFSKLPFPEKVE